MAESLVKIMVGSKDTEELVLLANNLRGEGYTTFSRLFSCLNWLKVNHPNMRQVTIAGAWCCACVPFIAEDVFNHFPRVATISFDLLNCRSVGEVREATSNCEEVLRRREEEILVELTGKDYYPRMREVVRFIT